MSFAFERVIDSDKEKIGIVESPLTRQPIHLIQWAADHERSAFLIWGGEEREPPHIAHFVFLAEGSRFHVRLLIGYEPTNQSYSLRSISPLNATSSPEATSRLKEILPTVTSLLKEALAVYARRIEEPQRVTFDF
jgi:hypothetical protein